MWQNPLTQATFEVNAHSGLVALILNGGSPFFSWRSFPKIPSVQTRPDFVLPVLHLRCQVLSIGRYVTNYRPTSASR